MDDDQQGRDSSQGSSCSGARDVCYALAPFSSSTPCPSPEWLHTPSPRKRGVRHCPPAGWRIAIPPGGSSTWPPLPSRRLAYRCPPAGWRSPIPPVGRAPGLREGGPPQAGAAPSPPVGRAPGRHCPPAGWRIAIPPGGSSTWPPLPSRRLAYRCPPAGWRSPIPPVGRAPGLREGGPPQAGAAPDP